MLLIFSFELAISGVIIQEIQQNKKKWLLPVNIFLVNKTLRLPSPISVVMTTVPTLLKHLRRSLQIKKIITNPFPISSSRKSWLLGHPSLANETGEVAEKK